MILVPLSVSCSRPAKAPSTRETQADSLQKLTALKAHLDSVHAPFPGFVGAKSPAHADIDGRRSDSTLIFFYSGFVFSIRLFPGTLNRPEVTVTRRNLTFLNRSFGSLYFDPKECVLRSFDADGNGHSDVFIEFLWGPTGRNSSIVGIEAFFFDSDTTFTHTELASFYHGLDLFRDYNRDGKTEFACIKWENSDIGGLEFVNLFAIHEGEFRNISLETPGFPVFILESESGKDSVLAELPNEYRNWWYLRYPDVWLH
jgi:hypothetical protein